MRSLLPNLPVDRLDALLLQSVRAAGYLVGAAILTLLLSLLFRRLRRFSSELIRQRGGPSDVELAKQTTTIATLVRRGLFTIIWVVAVMLALDQFGFNVAPVLAGAGVAGLALGFAAQSVMKDWINGFFLLTEGQIRMSDTIRIGDLTGTVENLTLRTTVLRGYDGSVHVVANGSIQNFTNLTLGHSYAVFDIAAAYDQDPARLMALLADVGKDLRSDPEFAPLVLEDMEVAGLDRFTEQGVIVKARIRTSPGKQWKVGREVNRRLRLKCEAEGVAIATARRVVYQVEKDSSHDSDPFRSSDRP